MGVIWDLHGAPGGQNAENISDSDGTARLWTEKNIYWPQTVDLWDWNHLYFYIQVQDDSLSTNSSVDSLNDGIEIYIDADNSKSQYFEASYSNNAEVTFFTS